MIERRVARYYTKLIELSGEMPQTATSLLYERLELFRLDIAHKVRYKLNLIQFYSLVNGIGLVDTVFEGSALALIICIILTTANLIIIYDLFELEDMEPSIDKLKEPNVDSFNPKPIGPFWF